MVEENKFKKKIKILNETGMHARPAARLVEKASGFSANIFIIKDDMEINAKSIMGVLMLAASKGTSLTFVAEGTDAEEALNAIEELITGYFDES